MDFLPNLTEFPIGFRRMVPRLKSVFMRENLQNGGVWSDNGNLVELFGRLNV